MWASESLVWGAHHDFVCSCDHRAAQMVMGIIYVYVRSADCGSLGWWHDVTHVYHIRFSYWNRICNIICIITVTAMSAVEKCQYQNLM